MHGLIIDIVVSVSIDTGATREVVVPGRRKPGFRRSPSSTALLRAILESCPGACGPDEVVWVSETSRQGSFFFFEWFLDGVGGGQELSLWK